MADQMIKSGAVIFAQHVELLAQFYAGVVPMTRLEEADGAIRLESETLQLVIHPLPGSLADGMMIDAQPSLRSQSAIKLVFAVDSLDHIRAQTARLGGGMAPAASAFVWAGFRACDGHDPEGNVIQFREPA